MSAPGQIPLPLPPVWYAQVRVGTGAAREGPCRSGGKLLRVGAFDAKRAQCVRTAPSHWGRCEMRGRKGGLGGLALLPLAALLGGCGLGGGSGGASVDANALPHAVHAHVIRAVDGDTALVRIDGATEYVRYIGVDTPETVKPGTPVECGGPRASTYNHRLVERPDGPLGLRPRATRRLRAPARLRPRGRAVRQCGARARRLRPDAAVPAQHQPRGALRSAGRSRRPARAGALGRC